jgi:hypothetical protein
LDVHGVSLFDYLAGYAALCAGCGAILGLPESQA